MTNHTPNNAATTSDGGGIVQNAQQQLAKFVASDYFLLRTPLLSIDEYFALPDLIEGVERIQGQSQIAKAVKESLLIASPSLASEASDREAKGRHQAISRYIIRMSTRATPFGSHAGVSLGHFSNTSALVRRQSIHAIKPTATISLEYLLETISDLEELPEVANCLRYGANPTVFRTAGRLFWRIPAPGSHQFDSVASTAEGLAVQRVLELASEKPRRLGALLQALASESPQVQTKSIRAFLNSLIGKGLLISELRPHPTWEDPLKVVLDVLERTPYRGDMYRRLTYVRELLDKYNELQIGEGYATFRQLLNVTGWTSGTRQSKATINTVVPLSSSGLPEQYGRMFADAGSLIYSVSGAPHGLEYLGEYCDLFIQKYGDREVPVLEVLDPDYGLGPPNRKLSGKSHGRRKHKREARLLAIAGDANWARGREHVLDEGDLACLALPTQKEPPLSMDVYGTLVPKAESNGSLEGDNVWLVIAPRVAALPGYVSFGRFGLLDSSKMPHDTEDLDTSIAELAYAPRVAHYQNLTRRPARTVNEVALNILGGSDSTIDLPLRDILVGARQGRLYLRLQTTGKYLQVQKGDILNPNYIPEVGRFLLDLSASAVEQPGPFDWGPAADLPFLPRLRYGQVVLSLARWRLPSRLVHHQHFEAWEQAFSEWRRCWDVDQYVYLTRLDQRLLLDLESIAHRQLVFQEYKTNKPSEPDWHFEEALPAPEHAWLEDDDGKRYLSEMVVPLRHASLPRDDRSARSRDATRRALRPRWSTPTEDIGKRFVLPGGNWLYFKAYAPNERLDDLLAELAPMLRTLVPNAQKRYFLRFIDPEPHLRLRFCFGDGKQAAESRQTILDKLRECFHAGLLQRVSEDTYEREIERYGGSQGVDVCEEIFTTDSGAIVEYLSKLKAIPRRERLSRHAASAALLDVFVRTFGLNVGERRMLYQDLAHAAKEFSGSQKTAFAERYRAERRDFWHAFEYSIPPLLSAKSVYDDGLHGQALNLRLLEETGVLASPVDSILPSLLHMHCNRMGLDRSLEMFVYYCLGRLFEGFCHHIPGKVQLS